MRSSSCRLSGISWKRWSGSKVSEREYRKESRFGNEAAFLFETFLLQMRNVGWVLTFLKGHRIVKGFVAGGTSHRAARKARTVRI